jgi:hypothetical protein
MPCIVIPLHTVGKLPVPFAVLNRLRLILVRVFRIVALLIQVGAHDATASNMPFGNVPVLARLSGVVPF